MTLMSLYLFDLTQAALPAPLNLPQMGTLLDVLGERKPGINPRFLELGQQLEQATSGTNLGWLNSPAQEALTVTSALWHLAIPVPQTPGTVHLVARMANDLGLCAYCDQIGIGFMPDKRITPANRSELWHAMLQEAQATSQPTRYPFSQVVAQVTERFTQLLVPHGFTLSEPAATPASQSVKMCFERLISEGRQCVALTVHEHQTRDGDMARACGFDLQTFHDAVSRVEMPSKQVNDPPTFELSNGFLGKSGAIDQAEDIEALILDCERRGLPLLDMTRDLAGLDQAFHGPSADAILSSGFTSLREHAWHQISRFAVAWLNGNPHFDQLAQQYLHRLTNRTQNSERMAQWLRTLQQNTPRLHVWADEEHWLSSHRPVSNALTRPPEHLYEPRLQHANASNRLITRSNIHPPGHPRHVSNQQVAAQRQAVADRFMHADAVRSLREYWNEQAATVPPHIRISPEGLDVTQVELPLPRAGEKAPFACLTFPQAIRPREVHFMAISTKYIFELRNAPAGQSGGIRHSLHLHDFDAKKETTWNTKFAPTREAFLAACAEKTNQRDE